MTRWLHRVERCRRLPPNVTYFIVSEVKIPCSEKFCAIKDRYHIDLITWLMVWHIADGFFRIIGRFFALPEGASLFRPTLIIGIGW